MPATASSSLSQLERPRVGGSAGKSVSSSATIASPSARAEDAEEARGDLGQGSRAGMNVEPYSSRRSHDDHTPGTLQRHERGPAASNEAGTSADSRAALGRLRRPGLVRLCARHRRARQIGLATSKFEIDARSIAPRPRGLLIPARLDTRPEPRARRVALAVRLPAMTP